MSPRKRKLELSAEQKRQWAIDGYLLLPGVLSAPEVKHYTRAVDRFYRTHLKRNKDPHPSGAMLHRNAMEDSDVFVELIDYPPLFDMVVELLGPYIQLSMSEIVVRAPSPNFKGFVHTDGGPAMRHIRLTETSWPLQLKVQYFLTNVSKPDSGNFVFFPGSHLRPFPVGQGSISADTPGTVQLCVKAGDVVIFPHSLWHGAAPNRTRRARKTLIYCYNQMCLRPYDFEKATPELLERCTPRQRRLLGDLGREYLPGAYFVPPPDHVEVISGKSG